MIIENTEALKSWLTTCLGRICDADPAALAKYVLALVKKDKPENELREFCLDQLDVFLLKNTKIFVDLLFDALKSKSYLNSTNDTPAFDVNSSSIPSATSVPTKASPKSTDYSSVNESVKCIKKETEIQLKETVNSDHSSRSRSSFRSTRNKSHSRSPTRKSSRHRDRSHSREGDYSHKRINSDDDEDERSKSHSFPSKKVKLSKSSRNEYYSKSIEDHKREDKIDKRNTKYGKEREQLSHNTGDRTQVSKSRSRSSSRERRRSRSISSQSRSRSLSRGRSREHLEQSDVRTSIVKVDHLKQLVDHGDTDYRQKPIIGATNSQYKSTNNYTSKITKRCQDYDEKGYCMRGDLCLFDHGTDPILVEDVTVLNVGVPGSQGERARSQSPLQPPLPPLPPPLPPLPPPGYVPEPYNPEAPGMNIPPREHMPYWGPPATHLPPPPVLPTVPGMPNVLFNINEPPPNFHNSKHHRTRELIGVPTVGNIDSRLVVLKEKTRDDETVSESIDNLYTSVVEKDKINNFAMATAESEVKRKGFDYNRLGPSPKKVSKFNSNRSTLEVRKIPKHLNTIAMLNNHFSKFGRIVNLQVSYDNDPEAALVQFMTHPEANAAYKSTDAVFNNRFIKVFWHNNDKINKGETSSITHINISSENKSQEKIVNNGNKIFPDNTALHSDVTKPSFEKTERSVIYSTKGNFSRTIFNPASLKKNNVATSTPVVKKPKEKQKDALQKRLELHKKKQEFLNSQLENQKAIMEKLSKCKTDKERNYLKQIFQTMEKKITSLQNEVKKDSEELTNLFKTTCPKIPVTKTEAEKELLDAEMDLYNKQHSGDDTAELLSKVLELKQKAKALGLIDNSPLGSAKLSIRRGRGRFLSRGLYGNIASRSIDRRKSMSLSVSAEEVPKLGMKLAEVVKMDEPDSSFNETIDMEDPAIEVEPDDEEDEDSEARSWRR